MRFPFDPLRAGMVALVLVGLSLTAIAQQGVPVGYLSVGGAPAGTLVHAGRAQLTALLPINTTTTLYYLKLYDKVVAPTCGTDTPKWRVPIPYGASNSGGGVAIPPGGLMFQSGFGWCLTGGLADNDTSAAATGITINFGVNGLPLLTQSSFTASISTTTLIVSNVTTGTIAANQIITGSGVSANTVITASTSCGATVAVSCWTVNNSQTVASTRMTGSI